MLSQSQSQCNINMYNEFNFVCVTSMMTGEVHHVLSMSITVCWNFFPTRGTYTYIRIRMKWREGNTGEWWCDAVGILSNMYECAITFVTRLNGRDNNFDFSLTFIKIIIIHLLSIVQPNISVFNSHNECMKTEYIIWLNIEFKELLYV